ncbi:NYN domain-containing protein [Phragmitibacter flavus]|uniref:NYN domain-containing protein n=2 Tax=Phragmitibacter flavus TaxID=2576071 RepID=A0A5R8K9X5_9BACT|nr:NYN domain-containing protein [Phragmitibacter flavus]
MAVFCDFENVAIGAKEAKFDKFDITKVLERLLLKGHIVVKKAYCDWDRYRDFKRGMHEAAFELIEIPHVRLSGKNSADIRMVVDALDLCYTKEHIDIFVIVSGDSDFSPLVSKLRENNKIVIGVGVKNSTSDLFIDNCDEFIFYDDLVRTRKTVITPRRNPPAKPKTDDARPAAAAGKDIKEPKPEPRDENKGSGDPEKALQLILDTADAMLEERNGEDTLWGSMIKQALKRRHPGFNERFHGFRTFNTLLEAARDRGLMELTRDEKSGNYAVSKVRISESPAD